MEDSKCGFCHTGEDTADICGSLHKDTIDGKTICAHHKCMQYSALLVQYKSDTFGGFKKHQVLDELKRGSRLLCSLCRNDKKKSNKKGATSGCALKNCRKTFHYYCVSMNPHTVAKRYRVAAGQKVVILYRVFCSKKHEELYRKNLKAEDVVGGQEESSSDSDAEASGGDSDSDKRDDDDDDTDATDVEPAHKKPRQGETQVDTDEDPGEDTGAPPMSAEEVIAETRKEYNSLLSKHMSRESPDPTNNGDDYEGGAGMMTDVSTSSHSESEASAKGNAEMPKGMLILIPSKFDVGDLKSICNQTGYPAESSVLWPLGSARKGLQDKHLPYVMWDIASKLRRQDRDGLNSIFTDLSVSQYECLQSFNVQTSEEDDSIHKRLFGLSSDVNVVFKREVCRLVNLTLYRTKLFVLILTLPNSYIAHIDTTVYYNLHRWSPETVFSACSKPPRDAHEHERKTLMKLLKNRLRGRNMEMLMYPQDDILINNADRCVARDIEFKLQTMPRGTGQPVKVLVVRNVDRGVLQYKQYLHKVLMLFMHNRDGSESYGVVSVKPADGVRTLGDLLPDQFSGPAPQVYSAHDPQNKPISCLLLYFPGTHSVSGLQNGSCVDEVSYSMGLESQASVYIDLAEC